MTLFRSSVEAWRPLVTQLANGKPIEFLLAWLDKESGGYPCDYTYLGEAGIGQLDRSNMASVGTNVSEQHPSGPCPATLVCERDPSTGKQTAASCPASSHAAKYGDLTDDQRVKQVQPWLDYVDKCIDKAQSELAQHGYTSWTPDTTSFWSMVKMGHVAPARIPVMLAQGLACNVGTPPADWDALMFCGPFPSTPQSWTDNAGSVGSYATGLKPFGTIFGGIIPTWLAVTLGIAGAVGAAWAYKRYQNKIPSLKSPLFGLNGMDGTKLWRLETNMMDKGYAKWHHVRDIADDNEADRWLAVFQKDEPNSVFRLSPTKPKGNKGKKIIRGPGSDY